MKRLAVTLSAGWLLAASFAGCSQDVTPSPSGSPSPPAVAPSSTAGTGDQQQAKESTTPASKPGDQTPPESFQYEHRLGRSLDDFFVARGFAPGEPVGHLVSTDSVWSAAGVVVPPGLQGVAIYSRRLYRFPDIKFHTRLPVLRAGAPQPGLLCSGSVGRQPLRF